MAKLLIVEARFYDHLNDMLVDGASSALKAAGHQVDVITVPGALEIPAAAVIALDAAAQRGQPYDGLVALGCVIRGETSHYDIVAGESARALMDLSVARGLPLGNGILTVETEAQAQGIKVGKGAFPWIASGRSLALNREEGFTKLLFDPETHRVLGAGIVGTNAGELISELALAIELGGTDPDCASLACRRWLASTSAVTSAKVRTKPPSGRAVRSGRCWSLGVAALTSVSAPT